MSELAVGDAVIITHPSTLLEETKIVRMVLSDMSMSLSSAFSTDLITTTPFTYIKAPKDKGSHYDIIVRNNLMFNMTGSRASRKRIKRRASNEAA